MSKSIKSTVFILLCVLLFPMSVVAESTSDEIIASTTKDPDVPVDELTIIVRPLTKVELDIEASAWMVLVQEKALEVSKGKIAVKRQNLAVKSAEKAAGKLKEAGKALQEADSVSTNKGVSEETLRAHEAADKALKQAQEATDQTVKASERLEEVESDSALVAESNPEKSEGDKVKAIGDVGEAVNVENVSAKASSAEQVSKEVAEKKVQTLERVNVLREELTGLIERTRVVLTALEKKGGDTEEQRMYLLAVSDVDVDVSDWDAVKSTAVGWVSSEQGGIRWLLNIANFVAVIVGFWILSIIAGRIGDRVLNTRQNRRMSQLMREFLSKSIRRVVLVIGFVVALASLEVNIGPIMAAIGAAGFVVAFALQDSLSNLASGIMILLYRPFDVGDVVETGGVSGTVTNLNLVSVGIKTFDNKQILVPNNKVWHDVIVNATGVRERRVDMIFGIGYEDDMTAAQGVLERIVEEHPKTLSHPEPVIRVHELADFSVNFICRPWVKTDDYWEVYWDITRQVKEQFDKAGINIPYPQQDVHMHQVKAEE